MNKNKIRIKYPKLFKLLRNIYKLFRSIKYPIVFLNFLLCLVTKKPYFGQYMIADITWSTRKEYMKNSLELAIKNFNGDVFRVMEIGSWAGGSAVLWARLLKQSKVNGMVCCVDSWTPYAEPEKDTGISKETLLQMKKYFKNDRIYKLFLHNIRTTGYADIIKTYKGTSAEILPTLRSASFNVVYIDGSHIYSQVIKDLKNSDRLVIDGGYLCGDDLEMQLHEVDMNSAKEIKEQDFVLDKKQKNYFIQVLLLQYKNFFLVKYLLMKDFV